MSRFLWFTVYQHEPLLYAVFSSSSAQLFIMQADTSTCLCRGSPDNVAEYPGKYRVITGETLDWSRQHSACQTTSTRLEVRTDGEHRGHC